MKQISLLEKSILDYFGYQNILCWKNNSVGFYDEKNKTFRKPQNTINGQPDMYALIQGALLGIELKTTDYLSRDQTLFMIRFILNGGFYIIIKSLNDLIASLKFYHFYLDEQDLLIKEIRTPRLNEFLDQYRYEEDKFSPDKFIPNANLIYNLKDEKYVFNEYSKIQLFLNIFGKYTNKIVNL